MLVSCWQVARLKVRLKPVLQRLWNACQTFVFSVFNSVFMLRFALNECIAPHWFKQHM